MRTGRRDISGGAEFELIETFVRAFSPRPSPFGPGDDCAVLPPSRESLCVTTDAVVEGVHFTGSTFTPEDVGHKALAVNLSDLAAMGASPRWFVCALAVPPWMARREVVRMGEGMAALATVAGILLVGGNVTRGQALSLTLTVAGAAPKTGPLLRSGGRPGDVLYVSGTLGGARLGYRLLAEGAEAAPAVRKGRSGGRALVAVGGSPEGLDRDGVAARAEALRRQRRPVPRLALGRLAAKYARAAIDVSDGLAQDAGHLCRASGCGAVLDPAALPLSPGVLAYCGGDALEAEDFALAGGEDYELLLAVPEAKAAAFEKACVKAGEQVTRVGRLKKGRPEVSRADGRRPLPPGFDHLSG